MAKYLKRLWKMKHQKYAFLFTFQSVKNIAWGKYRNLNNSYLVNQSMTLQYTNLNLRKLLKICLLGGI